jgi:predicted metal-dependent HD superfamily phosphohydrolase
MLRQIFTELVSNYNSEQELAGELWFELETEYSDQSRHYHTLEHVSHLIHELDLAKPKIKDWDSVVFAIFYHDIVYNGVSSENEQKSSILATRRLQQIGFPADRVLICKEHILSTDGHSISDNDDTNLFTDADLSILGQDWNTYLTYAKNIRKEFGSYPDAIYKPGRLHVLNHFLNMKSIFKTNFFFDKYEVMARKNLSEEARILGA